MADSLSVNIYYGTGSKNARAPTRYVKRGRLQKYILYFSPYISG